MPEQIPLTIETEELDLEALIHLPHSEESKVPGVVVCHPHPRHGGDMFSSVVAGVVAEIVQAGMVAMRFNFRGVGASGGSFAWGSGETDDAAAALETLSLREEVDSSRIGLAGYSFGAAVAIQAAMSTPAVQAVAAIAAPAPQMRAFSGLELLQPKLFILGDHDHDFPVDQFRFLTKRFADPRQTEVISGADHFFRGYEADVGRMAADFFSTWLKR